LLLCSGIGAGLEVFQPLVDALDPAIEAIRVDIPGVGGAPASALPLGFPQLAWVLNQLLDELGYEDVDVLGYSWGGLLAQQFAVQHGGRCRRLVLISTNTGMLSVPGDLSALAAMMVPRRFHDPADAAAATNVLRDSSRRWCPEELGKLFRNPQAAVANRGYLHQLAAIGAWTTLPFLRLIRQPVLVMSGDDDSVVPVANARLLAALIPHATLQIIPGGHSEIVNAADDLGRRVARFL
jgi:pimeloyl-ACP methyl ester carboxylesterase